MKAFIIPLVAGTLALGGCVTTTKIDASIANADSKLREQCFLLQGAAILAVAIKDDNTTRTIDDAISLYCTSARVDNALTAAQRVAEIYKLVSQRLKK
jgi:hypothetical protein